MNAAAKPASAGSNNNSSNKKRKYYSGRSGGGGDDGNSSSHNHNHNTNTNHNKWQRPKRGGPGFLVTCEVGREHRARRDALDLLQYYYKNTHSKTTMVMGADKDRDDDKNDDDDDDQDEKEPTAMLSLEEELKLLKSQSKQSTTEKIDQSSSNSNAPFGVYDTGCRGTVSFLCTLEQCRLIPSIQTEYTKAAKNYSDRNDGVEEAVDDNDDKETSKRPRVDSVNKKVEEEKTTSESSTTANAPPGSSEDLKAQRTPVWDPIDTFRHIYADWQAECKSNTKTPSTSDGDDDDNDKNSSKVSVRSINRAAPSSRYITRMVPIQATCFASLEELRLTAQELLARYFPYQSTATDGSTEAPTTTTSPPPPPPPPKTTTFAVSLKRRNCSTMSKEEIINTVAEIVLQLAPNSKVQLDEPDVTIVVEICQTLCGISVVEQCHTFGNFNLAMLKEQQK